MDIYFKGIWRMDWGLGNPNKTAALIALIMVAIWVLPFWKRKLFWPVNSVFAALGICLMQTMSRGGIVAAMAGFGIILWRLPRPWPWYRVCGVATAVIVILTGAVMLKTCSRISESWQDHSIMNRLDIWKSVPAMLVDAPRGWGIGNAGTAYCNWYQPLDRNERYRTLVNSHMTWLVELGWSLRLLYIACWAVVFILCFPPPGRTCFAVAFGTWLTFFVASIFSSVAESIVLWSVPILALIGVIIVRYREGLRIRPVAWLGVIVVSFVVLGILAFLTPRERSFNVVALRPGCVVVGSGPPNLWVVVDSASIDTSYPRALRNYCQDNPDVPSLGLATSLACVPDISGKNLAVIGTHARDEWMALPKYAATARRLILISPNVFPEEIGLPLEVVSKSTILFGEFTRQSSFSAWVRTGKVQRIEGVSDFLQDWPAIVLNAAR